MKKYLIFAMAALTSATAYATKTDGTWRVVEKSCAGKPAIISQDERIQFGDGMYAFIYLLSDSASQYCIQAQASSRVIQSASHSGGNYGEVAALTPYAVRTVCKRKQDDKVVSDQTKNVQGITQVLTTVLKADDSGFVDWEKSNSCPNGNLHLGLKKQ